MQMNPGMAAIIVETGIISFFKLDIMLLTLYTSYKTCIKYVIFFLIMVMIDFNLML